MKNVQLSVLGLSLVLLVAACKKNDVKETSASTATTALSESDTTGWKSATAWQKADQGTFSVHYFTIQDSAITSEVADNGLVLVFKKNGTAINTLPFEEGATGTTEATNANYWYHQVSEGNLLISYDVYKTTTADAANSFKYFVLTPQKLQTLQTSGYTTEKLMSLSYAETVALLKKTN